jgi:hypothetical protein
VSERERVAAWYDVLARQAVRLDAQPLSEHHRADGVVLGLPGLPISQACFSVFGAIPLPTLITL